MSTRTLWMREAELVIDGRSFQYDTFKVDFSIKYDEWAEPNLSEASIYNLTDNTINQIKHGSHLILNGGYRGDVGLLFLGRVDTVYTVWEGVDKITKMKISDAAEEWFYTTVSQTFARGIKASEVLMAIAGGFGLELGDFELANDITYPLGRSVSGPLYHVMKDIVKDTGSKMYIINSRMFIRPYEKGDPTGFVLNADTGLIESPERVEKDDFDDIPGGYIGYKVKSLLNHRINVDSIIQLESRTANGLFRVIEGEHKSDDWRTEFEVMPL